MSASTGTPAMPPAPMRPSPAPRTSSALTLDNHRIVTNPMEPRGCVGQFDPASGRYTLHVSSQNIHINRNHVARALGVEPKDVRFIAPDVGGGFGAKNFAYAEHVLVLWAARRIGRPVKWIASRSEVFLADHAARDMQAEAALALDADGQVPGARRSRASPISAPTWPAPAAACRPTSTSICRARCIASRRSRCISWRCSATPRRSA